MAKLTKEQFKYFEGRVRHWQDYFGLTEWDIGVIYTPFGHPSLDGDELVTTITSLEAMMVSMYVADDWQGDSTNKQYLNETAFHEVAEVMMAEVEEIGDARYVRKGELRSAVHKVINRIQKAILG